MQVAGLPLDRLWTEGDRAFYGATYSSPPVLRRDERGWVPVMVTVTNTGAAAWNSSNADEYRLGYHWMERTPDGLLRVADGQLSLPHPVPPGASAVVTMTVPPPRLGDPYVLAWDMLHSQVTWFSERGVPVATTEAPAASGVGAVPTPPTTTTTLPTRLLYPDLPPDPGRPELWQAAVQMFVEHPLLGVGPGTYRLRYGQYLGNDAANPAIHANSLYFELAATSGIVGLGAFLLVVGYVIWRAWPIVGQRSSPAPGWLVRAALVAAIVAFLGHGVFDYFLGFNGTSGLFWATLGLTLGAAEG